jgi:hypothetical protein
VGSDLIFPLVTGQTEINITNLINPTTGNSPVNAPLTRIYFHLIGKGGADVLSPALRIIPFRGAYQESASALFPNTDFSEATYIRVSASGPIAGTEVVRGFLVKAESAVLNGVKNAGAGNALNFVHAVNGSLGAASYTTIVGVINLASTAQTITITFNPEPNGSPTVVQRSLPPQGVFRESAQSLFGFSSGFQNGWIQVSGTSAITGFSAYADLASGGLAAVPVQSNPQTAMLFDQIAGPPTWYTGIGLLNASTTDANVEVFAMTAGGTLVGGAANLPSAVFTLPAGHKVAKLLTELIPAAASQNDGFIYVRTTNNVPLYGIELFGSTILPILSNVAASGIADGITYAPPAPSEPLILTSLSPAHASRASIVTLNGNGFGYPASKSTVVFATAAGTIEVPSETSVLTQITVRVPTTAIPGPVFVRTGGRDSPPVILDVIQFNGALIQTPITVTQGAATENADIYVPKSAAALQIDAIGVAELGATKFTVAPYAVDLPRGQTRLIVIVGNGVNASAGSTGTISGTGIKVDSAIVGGAVYLTVTVDSNAQVGPRTVFVTNPNQDTLSVPGGVYIR